MCRLSLALSTSIICLLVLSSISSVSAPPFPSTQFYNRQGKPIKWYSLSSSVVADTGVASVIAPYGCVGEKGADTFWQYTFSGAFVTAGAVKDGGVFANSIALEWMGYDTEPFLAETQVLQGSKIFEKCRFELYPNQVNAFNYWWNNGGKAELQEWTSQRSNRDPIHPFAEFLADRTEEYLGYPLEREGVIWMLGKTPPWVEEWAAQFGTQGSGTIPYSGPGPRFMSMTSFAWSFERYGPVKVVDNEKFTDFWYENDLARFMASIGYGSDSTPTLGSGAAKPYVYSEEAFQKRKTWWHFNKLVYTDQGYAYVNCKWWLTKWPSRGLPEQALDLLQLKFGTTNWKTIENDPRLKLKWILPEVEEKAYTADQLWTFDPENPECAIRLREYLEKYGNSTEEVNWLLAHEFQTLYGDFPWANKYSFYYRQSNLLGSGSTSEAELQPELLGEVKPAEADDEIIFGWINPEWEAEFPDLFDIQPLTPLDRASIPDTTPIIEAFITETQYYSISDLNVNAITLSLDGYPKDRTISSTTRDGKSGYLIRYQVTSPLSTSDAHTVKVNASNFAGNWTVKSWSFYVYEPSSSTEPRYDLEMKLPSCTWFVGMEAYAAVQYTRDGVPYNDDSIEAEIINGNRTVLNLTRISDGLYNFSWPLTSKGPHFIRVYTAKDSCFDTLYVYPVDESSDPLSEWRRKDLQTSEKVGNITVNATGLASQEDVEELAARMDAVENKTKAIPQTIVVEDTPWMGTVMTQNYMILILTLLVFGTIGAVILKQYTPHFRDFKSFGGSFGRKPSREPLPPMYGYQASQPSGVMLSRNGKAIPLGEVPMPPQPPPQFYYPTPVRTIQSVARMRALSEIGKVKALEAGLPIDQVAAYAQDFAAQILKSKIQEEMSRTQPAPASPPTAAPKPSQVKPNNQQPRSSQDEED